MWLGAESRLHFLAVSVDTCSWWFIWWVEEDKSDKKTFSRYIDSSPEVEICVNKILHHHQNGTHLKLWQLKYKTKVVPVIIVLLHMNMITKIWEMDIKECSRDKQTDIEMSLFSQVRVHYNTMLFQSYSTIFKFLKMFSWMFG